MNQYHPPKSFWKEAKQRNKELFAQGMETAPTKQLGITLHAKEVIWTPAEYDTEQSYLVWQTHYVKALGILASSLHMGEYVKSDVSSGYGLLDRYISYSIPVRAMRVGVLMSPNIDDNSIENPENPPATHTHKDDWLEVTKEDCELLITELRRGASGEFTINPHM